MMDRVRRPVYTVVLVLLFCAPAAWCAEDDPSPSMPSLAEVLKQADQMRQEMNRDAQAQQKALEAAEGVQPRQPAAAPPKGSKARGAKKASADATEKPKGFSDIRVTLDGSFDLHVQDADVRTVLRQLSAQAKKNIVTSSQVIGVVTADLYSVDFTEALGAVTEAAGLSYQKREDVVYVFTPAELTLRREERDLDTRVFHLAYLRAATARDLINGMLSPKGKAMVTPEEHTNIEALPAPTWEDQRRRNVAEDVLVVHDYEDILEKVARVIEKVDVKPEQVLVEATILSATLNDDNALGVDLQGLINNNFNAFGMTSDLTNIAVGAGGGVNDFNHGQSRISTNFTRNMPDNIGPPFTFGIVSDNVGAFIHALESVRDVTVLANPKILIVNKQRGEVLVGREDGYLTTVVTDTSAIEQVEFLETGTKLIVRPFVGKNDNIRLEIHPEDSSGTVEPADGTSEDSPALPRKSTTQVTTNIIIRDGKTVVIGGLFRDQVQTTRRQVPILGDIPWMGTLFRSTVDATTRAEVIILITPHLVRDASAEAIGERMRGMTERYRIGARNGLRWWGRNRLSADYLKRANQSWSQGDVDKAFWWLDLCLSLQPDLVEAMLLKERMTNEASWANPPQFTDVRYLVTRMLMQEIGCDADTILPPQRPLHDSDLRPEVRKVLGVEIKPTTSGVIRRKERFVPVPRKDSTVPGDVDMKPVRPATAPAPQAEKTVKVKTPPKPKKTDKPAKTAAPVKNPRPAKTPATQPKEPPKVKPKEQPKAPVKSKPKPKPKSSPTSQPAAAPAKTPDESDGPRLAPIEDQPVVPAPESSLSSKAGPIQPVPRPDESAAMEAPMLLPAVRSGKTKSDLPKANTEPAPKKTKTKPVKEKPKTEPVKETPKKKSDSLKPLERDGKSPTRRYLENGTLSSALLKNTSKK